MMWTEGGVLYTDRARRAPRHPGLRPMHKAHEWSVDWWLGRIVETPKGVVKVVAADNSKGSAILLLEHEDLVTKYGIPLVSANAHLFKGEWNVL